MKTNKKALKLIEMGLSPNTVLNLKESDIDVLFKKFGLTETTMVSKTDSATIQKLKTERKPFEVYEKEVKEDEEDPMDFEKGQRTQDAHQVGPSTNDGFNDYGDSMPTEGEMKESKKKTKDNAWAICTSQLGKEFKTTERSEWNAKQKNKYERCVKDVKQAIKEGKDPYVSLIEKEIVSLVERNLQPRMTKGDLIKMLSEQPTTAPTKPDVKPGVKPGTKPRTRPAHPGKNPNPGENPAPKAADKEKAKEDVIQVIMKLLNNGE